MSKYILKYYNSLIMLGGLLIFYLGCTLFTDDILKYDFLRLSRVSLIVIPSYIIIAIFMLRSYSGYYVENRRKIEFLFSSIISTLCADVFAYVQLCIMIKKIDFVMTFVACLGFQIVYIAIVSYLFSIGLKNRIKNKNSILITNSSENKKELSMKFQDYSKDYFISEVCDFDEENIDEKIKGSDAIFLHNVPIDIKEKLSMFALENNIKVYSLPSFYEVMLSTSFQELIDDSSMMCLHKSELSLSQRFFKRTFDIVFSIIILIVFMIPFLFIGIAIKLEDRGPVFYKQLRVSRGGLKFYIIKFRTMIVEAEKDGVPQPCVGEKDSRITKVGNFLRKTRLDEFPQFINILKGEMSVVGPRPERIEHVEKYEKNLSEFSYRLQVKSGLTGVAQIFGKYNTSPKDKLILDTFYINRYSFALDLSLIIQTISVLWKKDSTQGFSNSDTTEEKN